MYQKTIVVGHLGRDPEMRYTPSGTPVTTFTVATNRRWTDAQGQTQEKTTWFRVSAWAKLAELCNQFLLKGRLVLVEGEIDASAFTGQDGQPHCTLELTARTIRFLGGAGEGEQAQDAGQESAEADSVPF